MANYSAGTASVDIKPNFDGFVRKLRADLDTVIANLPIDVVPDLSKFAESLRTKLEAISAKFAVEVNPDTSTFAADLAAELEKVTASIGVGVEPDTTGFATELDTELAKINASVSVDVDVDVSDASLAAAEQKIRDRLSGISISVDVDADTSAAVIQLEAMLAAYRNLTMDVDANTAVAAAEIAALRAANATHTMDVDADTTAAAAQIAALQSTLGGGGGGGRGLGMGSLLNAGVLGISALPAAASLIASIGADVQTLGANIALLPGIFAGAAAGAMTLSIGLDNMKDAFSDSPKKAAKAYAELSVEGKRVVDSLKGFGPQWDRIKDSIQDTTLAGMTEPLDGLLKAQLPALEKGMTGVAGKFNAIAKTALGELSNDKSTAATATIFGNTSEAAGKLNDAVLPIISSIRTLSTTGSSFLPRLAESFAGVATKFDAFITKSEKSGDLWRWMDRGLNSAGKLGSILGNLGSSLNSIFGAQRAEGETFLSTVDRLTERMATWLKSTEGQSELKAFFREGGEQMEKWKPILASIGDFLKTAYEAAQAWSGILLPFLTAASSLLTSHDGILKTLIISYLAFKTIGPIFGLLSGAIAGASGALGNFQTGMANSTATTSMGKALGGLGAMLGAGGLFGIALIGATIGLGLLAQQHQKAANAAAEQKRKLDELRGTLDEQSGAITEETRRTVAQNLQDGGSVENGRNVFDRANSFGIGEKEFLDAGLTDAAGRARINQRLTQTILEDDEVANGGLWNLAKEQTGLSDSVIAQALAGVPEALEKYTQAAGDSGVTLTELKGRLGDVGESAATLGGELNNANSTLGKAREEWQQTNDALNGTFALTEEGTAKFRELGLSVLDVPNAKTVTVQTNSPEQIQMLKDLGYEVTTLPNGVVKIVLSDEAARAGITQITKPESKIVNVILRGDTGPQTAGVNQDRPTQAPESVPRDAEGNRLPGRALGGPILGGVQGRDSVPIMAMPGEHMLTTSDVDKMGGQSGVYRFRAALQAGLVKPMAKGGAVEWTQKNEIDLQQAQTAVTQAEENAARVNAKAGASDADKRQAQLKVDEARYKAQQLQNKKDGTSSATTVAPQAALPGRASSSELSRADAEDAVDQANAKRNQVYNDPKATDADKKAADRSYQKAQNSLESLDEESGSSDGGLPEEYTAQGIGSALGSALATGLLSFFGLENSIFSSSNTYNKALNTAIDYYSDGSTTSSPTGEYAYTPKEVELEDSASSSSTDGSATAEKGEVTYNADGGVEQWRPTFSGVLNSLALPSSWLSLGLAQMQTESGGNPQAINNSDSNAAKGTPSKGLMQVIDPTFATYQSSLYTSDIWDPEANIAAALLYTQARYGSPVGVWGQGRGYAAGGWITGGIPGKDSVPIIGMPEEFIVNAAAAKANAPLLEAINAGVVPSASSLPAGFGSAATSSTSNATTNDRSVNYWGDNYVMNPEELFRQQDRHVEQQSIGPLAAFS
ncbi:transglycosylase SLT domain-containing protein [Nocardia sp. NPDC058480]|uniref:transglycosylase SLT domain-containing protein n=1 Tax=Nocardia sp. NPDC058480 TaxID=3346522 RepID=UPI003653AC17